MSVAEWTAYASLLPAIDADDTLRLAEAAALPWIGERDRRRALHRLQSAAGLSDAGRPGHPTPIDGLRFDTAPPRNEPPHA